MPTRTQIFIAIVLLVIVASVGSYVLFTVDEDSPNEETEFEHTFIEHDQLDTVYEEPPEYNEALVRHNNLMDGLSYQLSYSRLYEGEEVDFLVQADRSERTVWIESTITHDGESNIREAYYEEGFQYIRIRMDQQSSGNWQYARQRTEFSDISRTGFSELNALNVRGVEFTYSEELTHEGTTYYVYTPEVTDREAFESNRLRPDDASGQSDITGEVLVSERGIVTSAKVVYTVSDHEMNISFTVDELGDLSIDEPIWLSEAQDD